MITLENGKLHFTRPYVEKNLMSMTVGSLLMSYSYRLEYEKKHKGYKPEGLDAGFIPRFQRNLVWSLKQKQDLILSIMDNLPIGTMYINRVLLYTEDGSGVDYSAMSGLDTVLYDGQQRFTAIKDFLEGRFPIEVDGGTYYISDFDDSLRQHILTSSVSIVETAFDNLYDLVNYYIKINRGGTLHTEVDIQKALNTI